MMMPNDVLTLDIEASGLTAESYPVSIGVAGNDQAWIWYVTPLGEWVEWCEIAAGIHGIDRDFLLSQGRDPFLVAREMNAIFKGRSLMVNSEWDQGWLAKLFDESSVRCAFEVKRLDQVFAASVCHSINDAFESAEVPHEADKDATVLREAILAALAFHAQAEDQCG
ncbi:hypothetical protein IFT69_15925 [Pseudomonas putida]|nr:hypothetical protein [Pseudomonas putida]